jgi:hypothetical protein
VFNNQQSAVLVWMPWLRPCEGSSGDSIAVMAIHNTVVVGDSHPHCHHSYLIVLLPMSLLRDFMIALQDRCRQMFTSFRV